jgi:hypothetical protein
MHLIPMHLFKRLAEQLFLLSQMKSSLETAKYSPGLNYMKWQDFF